MENIVLTVHLLLAVALIALVLLQRSEGGGLGMGGGGGGGVMTGRQAANALTRVTWILAGAFLITSLSLTIIAARNVSTGSVIDQLNIGSSAPASDSGMPALPGYTPPPPAGSPIVPGAAAPATTPAAETPAPAAAAPETTAPATTEPAAAAPDAPAAPATQN